MDRLSRLVAIVVHLQSRRVVRAEDMAEHFGVSIRTIYRDLRALEETGVPIAAEAGKGYSLVEGYHLPPVMFTQEEAGALFIGGEFVERMTDASLADHARSALTKIRAVLPPERKEFIERLQQSTAIHLRRSPELAAAGDNLATMQDAVAGRRVLRIVYRNVHDDETTAREVEPLATIFYADHWHLIAYCRLRDDIRDFRVDRVQELETCDERFPERKDFSLRRHIEGLVHKDEPQEVRLLFTRFGARFTTDRHYFGFIEETRSDNGVEMTFFVQSLAAMARWTLSFGGDVRVLYPDALRTLVRAMALDIAGQYEESSLQVIER